MVVRFDNKALKALKEGSSIGVEGDNNTVKGGISEADAIVSEAKKHQTEGGSSTENASGTTPEAIPEENEDVKDKPIELNAEAVKAAQKHSS